MSLLTRHRPSTYAEVVGQEAACKALQKALKEGASRAYLLTGPSGVGKTTLARIAAGDAAIQEIDAATHTGIDDMRAITEELIYRPLGGKGRAIIVDEIHALSKQAFTSLLKSLEEPPPDTLWFLCTTESTKVPQNIRTRCINVDLKPIKSTTLGCWLKGISDRDELGVPQPVLTRCAKEAKGSARQALANLGVCLEAKTDEDAAQTLGGLVDDRDAIDLARALLKGAKWDEVWDILVGLKEANPESVRHVVRAYLTKVALGAKTAKDATHCLAILEAFEKPFYGPDGITPLVLACGRLTLA